jgi:hypothetical protein
MAKEWNEQEFREYLQEHHGEYEPIFYSGQTYDEFHGETVESWKEAEWYASQHPECKTVGTLVSEAGYDPANVPMGNASQVYAEKSSGKAHCFFGDTVSPDSDWVKYEREAAINNTKIDNEVERFNLVPEQAEGVRSYSCDKSNLPDGSQQGQGTTSGGSGNAGGEDAITASLGGSGGASTGGDNTNKKGHEL